VCGLCSVEVTYILTVKTGGQQRAETDAVVYCILTGSQGRTAQLNLRQPLSHEKPFCRAQAFHSRYLTVYWLILAFKIFCHYYLCSTEDHVCVSVMYFLANRHHHRVFIDVPTKRSIM